MNLPEGVTHQPNRTRLCGNDDDCLIRLAAGYEYKEIDIGTGLIPYLSGDWFEWAAAYSSVLDNPGGVTHQPLPLYAVASNREFRLEIIPEIHNGARAGDTSDPVLLGSRFDRFPSPAPASPIER